MVYGYSEQTAGHQTSPGRFAQARAGWKAILDFLLMDMTPLMRPIHGPRAYIWTSILRWYFDDSGPMYLLYDVFYTVPLDVYRSMFIYGISLLFHILLQDVRHIPVRFICRIFWMCVEPCLETTFRYICHCGAELVRHQWGLLRGDFSLALRLIMGLRA